MLESEIQRRISEALKKREWFVIKLIQTSCNGIPDLLCLKAGCTVFVEVKQPGRVAGDLQKYRHDKLRKQGFEVIVATSLKDVEHLK